MSSCWICCRLLSADGATGSPWTRASHRRRARSRPCGSRRCRMTGARAVPIPGIAGASRSGRGIPGRNPNPAQSARRRRRCNSGPDPDRTGATPRARRAEIAAQTGCPVHACRVKIMFPVKHRPHGAAGGGARGRPVRSRRPVLSGPRGCAAPRGEEASYDRDRGRFSIAPRSGTALEPAHDPDRTPRLRAGSRSHLKPGDAERGPASRVAGADGTSQGERASRRSWRETCLPILFSCRGCLFRDHRSVPHRPADPRGGPRPAARGRAGAAPGQRHRRRDPGARGRRMRRRHHPQHRLPGPGHRGGGGPAGDRRARDRHRSRRQNRRDRGRDRGGQHARRQRRLGGRADAGADLRPGQGPAGGRPIGPGRRRQLQVHRPPGRARRPDAGPRRLRGDRAGDRPARRRTRPAGAGLRAEPPGGRFRHGRRPAGRLGGGAPGGGRHRLPASAADAGHARPDRPGRSSPG